MLLEFSCSNHRSIRDKVTFSMLATQQRSKEEELFRFGKDKVVRSAVIYGGNGTGKSSLLEGISYLKALIVENIMVQPGDKFIRRANKQARPDEPSFYSANFICNGMKYSYSVAINNTMVTEEYLSFFQEDKEIRIFERGTDSLFFKDKFKNELIEIVKKFLKPNRLLLSCVANYSNIKEIEEVFMFFKEDLVLYPGLPKTWINFSARVMKEQPNVKQAFLEFMKETGSGVIDVVSKYDRKKLEAKDMPPDMPDVIKNMITANETEIIDVKMVYENYMVDLFEESNGMKKMFEMFCPMVDILSKGKVFICDELENSLHEKVALEVIKLFRYVKKEEFAQLIFSTHNTSLLDSDMFQKDQIWFTELTVKGRNTDIYPLADLNELKYDASKSFIKGKHGNIPILNTKFLEKF